MKKVLIQLTGFKFKFAVDEDQVEIFNKREEIKRQSYVILNRGNPYKAVNGDKELYEDLENQIKQLTAEIRPNIDIVYN